MSVCFGLGKEEEKCSENVDQSSDPWNSSSSSFNEIQSFGSAADENVASRSVENSVAHTVSPAKEAAVFRLDSSVKEVNISEAKFAVQSSCSQCDLHALIILAQQSNRNSLGIQLSSEEEPSDIETGKLT